MTKITFDAGRVIQGWASGDLPTYAVVETPNGGSISTGPTTDKDVGYTEITTTGAENNCKLIPYLPFGVTSYEFTSVTPSICSVDAAGNVSRVSNGNGHVTLDTIRGRISFKRAFSQSVTVVQSGAASYVVGSLGKHVRDSIATMVSGKTPSATTQNVLTSSSGGWAAPNHVRNPSLFTGALDLTAISVYTEQNDCNRYPMVLIASNYVLAGHAGTYPGKKVVFKNSVGNYEVRTVIAQVEVNKTFGDDFVGVLDAPINTITPMALMPASWNSYWPSYNKHRIFLPVLNKGWTAGDKIRILENYGIANTTPDLKFLQLRPNTQEFTGWTSDIIGGDSNGPVFIPVNGAPVLLHCMNYSSGGANYANYLAEIQYAMNALSLDYSKPNQSPTYANLSGFTSW